MRLRREEQRAWWAGNGRDLLNAVGFAAVTAALRGYGFPLPAALFSGASLTLALFGTTVFMEGRDHIVRQRGLGARGGARLAVPVLLFAGPLLARWARSRRGCFRSRG